MNCLVTGVSRGIGRATTFELLRQGHRVWGLSRTAVATREGEEGARFRHSRCDLGDPDSRQAAADEMDSAGFVPDAVVLNAAVEYEEELTGLSWDRFQGVLRTNVEGALFWISRWMDRNPRTPMQFVGISTILAQWPDPDCPAYSASKAALSLAFRSLRLRHAGEPVAFKLLVLGPVQTAINPRFAEGAPVGRGVVAPEAVAGYIVHTVLSKRRFAFYYPWQTALVCRFGAWMPDRMFEFITRPLRR
jgi:NAD(P)-dependent dehydrogenase (short-subunit alcohol dehydrogenase family)